MISHGSAQISLPRQLRNWLVENKARYGQRLDALYDAAMDNVVVTLAQSIYGKKRQLGYLLSKRPIGGYDHVFSPVFSEFYKSWINRLEQRGVALLDIYGNSCRDLHRLSYTCYNVKRVKIVQSHLKQLRTVLETMFAEMREEVIYCDCLSEPIDTDLAQLTDLVKMRWGDDAVENTGDIVHVLRGEERALMRHCMTACLDVWFYSLHKVNAEFIRLTEDLSLECIPPNGMGRIEQPVDFTSISRGLYTRTQRAIDAYENKRETQSLSDMKNLIGAKAFIPIVAARYELFNTARRCIDRLIDNALLCHILDRGRQMGARTGNDLFAPSFAVMPTRRKDTLATVRLNLESDSKQLKVTVDITAPHLLCSNEMDSVLRRIKRHLNRYKYNLRFSIDQWELIDDPNRETLLRSPEMLSARGALNKVD